MKCPKSDICAFYPRMCKVCEVFSNETNQFPYFTRFQCDNVKFKIFWGNHTSVSADTKLNQWLDENPDIKIQSYQYQQARLGDHSICVEYVEVLGE